MNEELVALIEQLSERVSALEHTVNDTIIGGWKKADEEYKDQEAYEAFSGKYGPELDGLKPYFTKLYGEEFDFPRSLYDELKKADGYGTDTFDEDGLMKAKLDELHSKFDGWDLVKDAVEKEAEACTDDTEVEEKDTKSDGSGKEEDKDQVPTVDELKEIYRGIK